MLPISLLKAAEGSLIFLELKNGETFNGKLSKVDTWMNLFLTDAIRTSREGDKFLLCPEVSIRGNSVKFFRIEEGTLEKALAESQATAKPKTYSKPPSSPSSERYVRKNPSSQRGNYSERGSYRGRGDSRSPRGTDRSPRGERSDRGGYRSKRGGDSSSSTSSSSSSSSRGSSHYHRNDSGSKPR